MNASPALGGRRPGRLRGALPAWQLARWVAAAALGALLVAWVISLAALWYAPLPARGPLAAARLGEVATERPGWGDTLVIELAIAEPGLQRRLGFVAWTNGAGEAGAIPLHVLADGRPRRYVLPLGAHPSWRGRVEGLRIEFPRSIAAGVTVAHGPVVARPPWALDAGLLAALAPALPRFPPWPHVVILVGAALAGLLALALPISRWRRRLVVVAAALGVAVGGHTAAQQLGLVSAALAQGYAGLSEREALERAPAYHDPAALNAALVRAAYTLPDGPVLLVGADADDYLSYRARYLLYPRPLQLAATTPAELLAGRGGYVGLIRRGPGPPIPSWQQLAAPEATVEIWHAGAAGAAPPESPGAVALLRLAAGLALLGGLGWPLAGMLGLRAGERLAGAWVFGTTAAALWLFALDRLGAPWTLATVGAPLLTAALGAAAASWAGGRRVGRARLPRRPGWETALWCAAALLWLAVLLQALLLPFGDQDTWRMWGLKGKAFYLDRAITPVLLRYPEPELHQPAYPPAQPLLLAFGYLTMGGVFERAVKLVFPLWYGACLLLTAHACARWAGGGAGAAWTLLLAATPLLLDHATLGNADLALATALLLGAIGLAAWVERGGRRQLAAGAAALVAAAWIKVDGLYLGAAFLALAVAVRLIAGRGRGAGAALGLGALAVAALVGATLPWAAYTHELGLRVETPALEPGRLLPALHQSLLLVGEELLLSHNNSAWGLLGGGFGPLWLICGATLVAQIRRCARDPVAAALASMALATVAFYVLVMAVYPLPSVERFLLHGAPIAVLAAARASGPARRPLTRAGGAA